MASIAGLSVHTLRYYERIGLVQPVQRNSSGYREYAESDIAWLEFLTRLRLTGMSIRDMKRYAVLRNQGPATVIERRQLLEAHRREIECRMESLKHNLAVITYKIDLYKKTEEEQNERG